MFIGGRKTKDACQPGRLTFSLSTNQGLMLFEFGLAVLLALAGLFLEFGAPASSRAFAAPPDPQSGQIDFSQFRHDNQNHARLPCLLCHRRESNDPRPAMPGAANHTPCVGCHAEEFKNSSSKVCTICHTDVQAGTLKPFPKMSSFGVRFDHSKHVQGRASCGTCHRPSQGGVALSIPTGFNAHSTCYTCHSTRAESEGRDISSCGTCHQVGAGQSGSQRTTAFRVGFRHDKHTQANGLNCLACHRVAGGPSQMSAPTPLNHHASPRAFSCMSCHNGKRAFGGDDFSVCKRCHTGDTWRFSQPGVNRR